MNILELNIQNEKLNNNGDNKKLKSNIRHKIINKLQDRGYSVDVEGKKLTIKHNGNTIGTIEEVPKRKSKLIEPMYGNPYMVNAGPGLDLKFIFADMIERMTVEGIIYEVLESENNNGDVPMIINGNIPMNINNEYNGGKRKRSRKSKNLKTLKLKHSRRSLRRKTR